MDHFLLSVVGLGALIIGIVIWLSRRRPDSRVRQWIARADGQLAAQDFDTARELIKQAEEPFALVQDESERRELRSEIDRRLGSIALINDEYDEARQRLSSAVEDCDTLLSPRDPSSLGPLGNLAIVQFEEGDDLRADAAFERILAYEPNEYPPELLLTAETIHELAMACAVRDSYRWPERLLLRAIEHLDDNCDPTGDRRVRTWLSLAQLRFIVTDYRGSRDALNEACWTADDESHYSTFSFLRGHLAIMACDWDEAEQQLQANHQLACRASGERSNAAAEALGGLAELQRVQGRFSEARDLSCKALEVAEECWGADHVQVAGYLVRDAMICLQLGELSQADRHLDRAIELALRRKRRRNSLLGVLHLIRGIVERERERFGFAADALLKSRRIAESVYGRGHRMTMDPIMILADVRLAQERVAVAVPLAEEAVSICRLHGQTSPLDRADLHHILASSSLPRSAPRGHRPRPPCAS